MGQLRRAIGKIYDRDATEQAVSDIASFGTVAVPKLIALLCQQRRWYEVLWQPSKWWVRRNAAQALGQITDSRAIGPLISALEDTSVDVQLSAQTALQSFDTPEAIQAHNAFALRRNHILQEQIFFVRAIQPKKNRWMAEAIFVAAGDSGWYPDIKWTAWRLGTQPELLTCEVETYRTIGLASDRDGRPITVYDDEPRPLEERQIPYQVITAASNLKKFFIEPVVRPSILPFFLVTVPNRVPCAYLVTVMLCFETLAECADTQRNIAISISYFERLLARHGLTNRQPSEDDHEIQFQKQSQEMFPEPDLDLPVSVDYNGRAITGVLRLKEAQGNATSQDQHLGQTFTAELYLSDTVSSLAPGTQLIRSVVWREDRTENAVEKQVATILGARPLLS